jgi:predicted amidohydrolase YtcJ
VRFIEGEVSEIGELKAYSGEVVVDGNGCALLPSLADHHLHLFALAAKTNSLLCGPPDICSAEAFIALLGEQSAGLDWLRGIGYHESVVGLIDRQWLDKYGPARPIRIQHRGGRLWILNTLGLDVLRRDHEKDLPVGLDIEQGHLFDEDLWLRHALGGQPPDLGEVSRVLASFGVSCVTDMTPQNDAQTVVLFKKLQAQGKLRQRVLMAGVEGLDFVAQRRSLQKEKQLSTMLEIGPYKIHLHEAQLPEFSELCRAISTSHSNQRPIAVHCVTEVELVFALAALKESGAIDGDRIEHASVTPPELMSQIKELGLLVVTQPNFVSERGDQYLNDVESREVPWLYRCRTLIEAGIDLAGGTDAPFGHPDPWLAMKAAVNRQSIGGRVLNLAEALTPEQALELFLGCPYTPARMREVVVGAQADLCLLDRKWHQAREILSSEMVRATWCNGALIYDRVD